MKNLKKDHFLFFCIPELNAFEVVSKKALYLSCVKVSHQFELKSCKESKWLNMYGQDASPRNDGDLYISLPMKNPLRIFNGGLYIGQLRRINIPPVGKECSFCAHEESLKHLFLDCTRLNGVFQILKGWLRTLGEDMDENMFIFGPKYVASDKRISLINFLIGEAKLAIWITRKNKLKDSGTTEPELVLKAFVSARIKAEFAFF